jgi:hypothetical protein
MFDNTVTSKRRRLLAGSLAITALCAQYTTVLMTSQATVSTTAERAHWNKQEVTGLVDYLHDHRAAAGDGGNFKQSTFNAAAAHLAPLLTLGAKKTGAMCKTKWMTVSFNCEFISCLTGTLFSRSSPPILR